jgi:hypothetical protein
MRQVIPMAIGLGLITVMAAGASAEVTRPTPEIVLLTGQAAMPTILRGSAATPKRAAKTREASRMQIVGGRKLWVVDPKTKEVRGCVDRHTSTVGVREVRCTVGTLGRYRRGFGPNFQP